MNRSIDLALAQTGRGDQRLSSLQPKLMMWLVLCLSVFRSESIPAVLARLLRGLRDMFEDLSLWPVGDGALSHARARLGIAPLRRFFHDQAQEIRPAPSFRGLRVWSLDGTMLSMPDTPDNRRVFGRLKASRGRAAFPQLKMVALQDVDSRRLRDMTWRLWNMPERPMAVPLLRHLQEGDLVLADRGFYAAWFFEKDREGGGHFLGRVPDVVQLKASPGTSRKSGDYLAWIEGLEALPKELWHRNNSRGVLTKHRTARLQVRVIEYRRKGFRRVRLVTSLLTPSISPREWVLQYHRRWEIELALDEVKTHQSGTAQGTPKTLFRSHTARNVMQEAYALAATYNLIRGMMAKAAQRRGLDSDKISFVDTLRAITHMLPRMRGARAELLGRLYRQL
ncbi:MAG TPA: IS4 family transposase, partial [Planctomycetota bacterium]|nr:IS4 family transposase [Planctomycetota bacterium]